MLFVHEKSIKYGMGQKSEDINKKHSLMLISHLKVLIRDIKEKQQFFAFRLLSKNVICFCFVNNWYVSS